MNKIIILFILVAVFAGQAFAAVNINTASQAELEALQGIGPAKARAIIEFREKNGLFTSIEGLVDVDGIGPGTMKQLRDSITVGSLPSAETSTAMAVSQE